MADEIFLERMTSPEVGAALKAGRTTVIVACGATEQHGPHLPLFTDAEHGTRLAADVARRMGNALVAPTIRIGRSDHHMHFAGSITLRPETFQGMCEDYASSLAHHGFRKICFLPSHGGNFAPLAEMLPRLREVAKPADVLAYTDLLGVMEVWTRVVQEETGLGERVGGHADIAESSVMLALHPDLVHQDLAEDGYHPTLEPGEVERLIGAGFHTVAPNGILGDARGMTRRIGERSIEALADAAADFFSAG